MKKYLLAGCMLLAIENASAQFIRYASGPDSANNVQVSLEGYVDAYFGYDFNQPQDGNRPYFVSANRHSEVNVNLAYLSLKLSSDRVRATFTPGFGTYMNANYTAERTTLRNIVEANVGVKLFKHKNIWLDAGIINSFYTNESAISFDQLMYSRSLGAEYVPYYLAGAKLSLPLTDEVNLYLYLLNGWQEIEDINSPLSFGSQVEYKPNDKLLVNWNTYVGDERSNTHPTFSTRYFSDVYAIYNPSSKWSFSSSVYGGIQTEKTEVETTNPKWWQANLIGRYSFAKNQSLAARGEYFSDPHAVMVVPVTNAASFSCSSASLCYTIGVTSRVLVRLDARYFWSAGNVFFNPSSIPINNDFALLAGITAKF
ncbi:outer membrane beta-barrel protein [Taibaiella soli]|uniref:Porin n=1 Tax=Taibaiella soli TaxID=1649169 RepID=A0A2W2ANE3_9BACT|nr:outer membrane beta-barrel protein [Taibaiella soli]PZF73860.1 porin [Taibaiella soli]